MAAMDVLLTDLLLKLAGFVLEAVVHPKILVLNALLLCIKTVPQIRNLEFRYVEMDLKQAQKSEMTVTPQTEMDVTATVHPLKLVGYAF